MIKIVIFLVAIIGLNYPLFRKIKKLLFTSNEEFDKNYGTRKGRMKIMVFQLLCGSIVIVECYIVYKIIFKWSHYLISG